MLRYKYEVDTNNYGKKRYAHDQVEKVTECNADDAVYAVESLSGALYTMQHPRRPAIHSIEFYSMIYGER